MERGELGECGKKSKPLRTFHIPGLLAFSGIQFLLIEFQ
jgi:hypothetical protein